MERLKQRYRYPIILLKQLVKTDFKLRYQGSVLGYIWSLLRPFALFIILYLVFAVILGAGDEIPHYPVYLLLGIVLWNYFAEVTLGSVGAIVGRGDLMRKINFPRYVVVLAGSFSALINLLLNFVVIGMFMAFNDVELRPIALVLPVFIAELFVFSLAMAFFLSAAFVRFRDISYIWDVIMQAAFYATPILYPMSLVIDKSPTVAKFMLLNPVAQIIQDARLVLVTEKTQTIQTLWGGHLMRLVPVGITLFTVVVAAIYFRRRSRFFAEEV